MRLRNVLARQTAYATVKMPSAWEWYGILRRYHHFSVLASIRYALYLRGWITNV